MFNSQRYIFIRILYEFYDIRELVLLRMFLSQTNLALHNDCPRQGDSVSHIIFNLNLRLID